MVIVDDQDLFRQFAKYDDGNTVKFVIILNKFYAVSKLDLLKYWQVDRLPRLKLEITEELLNSFEFPSKSLDEIQVDELIKYPVIMFERVDIDDVYFRHDGRHRILKMASLGYNTIPAIYVPRSIWATFIIHYQPDDPAEDPQPIVWDRCPWVPEGNPTSHYEPSFVLPTQTEPQSNPQRTRASTNAELGTLMKKRIIVTE